MAMPGRTRLIGPAVYKARRGIEDEMEKMVLKTINEIQKDFKADATAIAQPAIQAAKLAYSQFPLSGMAYRWADRGRKIFPFTISGAQAGVKMRFDTRRNAVGVILIEQKNAATAVFEGAGRKDTNR